MKTNMACILAAAVSAAAFHTLGTDAFTLTADATVDVALGETKTYCTLDGGAYTLTKTGGGTLVFETISNSSARIVVEAGTLDVRTAVPAKPSILSSAWLHLDATDSSTLTTTTSDGVTTVTQWRDVNGGSITLNAYTASANPSWRTSGANRLPFITESFRNGRNVVDLGAVLNAKTAAAGAGHGAAFTFSASCSTMREAFLVVGDTEDSKRSYVDYGAVSGYTAPRCSPLLGTWSLGAAAAPFIRGTIANYGGAKNSSLAYAESTVLGYSKCEWTLDGADVDDPRYEILPDGLHLVEIRAEADSGIVFNSLGTERNFYFGGLRYGELAIFESELSSDDRAAVRDYLSARWLPIDIAYLELGEDSSLVLADAVTLHPANFKAAGSAIVTGGALKIDSVDRQGAGCVTFSGGECTIRPDVSGQLPDLSFPGGGVVNAIGVASTGGHVTVTGSLVKRGGGSFTAADVSDGVGISVEGGTMSIDPFVIGDESWMHLDASVTNSASMTLGTDSGTNVVSQWRDPRFSSRYAYQNAVARAPWLREGFQNGLPVLDFGGYSINYQTPNARGGWMQWMTTCSEIYDVFTVASDTEDLDDNFENIRANCGNYTVQPYRGAPFVGNLTTPHFLRNNRPNDGSERPGILYNNSATMYNHSTVTLDGTGVVASVRYPAGFHVLNIKLSVNATGNAFARDRNQISGGTRIGEFMVFTNNVTEQRRGTLVRGLMSKWLGGDNALVRTNADVAVAAGAALEVPYQTLAPTGSTSVAGSLEVGALRLSKSAAFGPESTFAGDLELVDGASLTFPSNALEVGSASFSVDKLVLDGGDVTIAFASGLPRPEAYSSTRILSFSSVDGTANLRPGGSVEGLCAKFSLGDDGIYAEFIPVGTMLLIR